MYKEHIFINDHELYLVNNALFELADYYHWKLEAWAIFPSYYHFISHTSKHPTLLKKSVTHFHANTARKINASQGKQGRLFGINSGILS